MSLVNIAEQFAELQDRVDEAEGSVVYLEDELDTVRFDLQDCQNGEDLDD